GPNPPTGMTQETVAANCRREFDLGGTGRLIFRTGNTINETTSTFVGQDPVLASGASPARFNVFLDSDEGGNPALRLGTKRGVARPTGTPLHSELDFYYDITRSISGGSAGFLTFTGNQTDPNTGLPAYVGYEFNKGNITFGTANTITLGTTTFANLGTPANGTMFYCSDCTQTTTCGGSGGGAIAKRIAGGWQCN
ncbi:MAG: hypothetical protein H7Y30_00180, partial [Pyrinomonadaceae bacterium]|nr:hypothetical protein [Pyrinomonadaceae bacterium]